MRIKTGVVWPSVSASALLCVASPASAQTTAPAAEPVAKTSQDTSKETPKDPQITVTVKGKRAEVTDRIDRRVYDIKNDPDSQSGVAADILGKLPSVTVTPTGRLALRGDSNVTVLVDGKPPINGNSVLQTLSSADIDRIEVITNPSSQYAADGTTGIINIITKKHHAFGFSGTLTARVMSNGGRGANGSISLTKGQWTLTARASANHFQGLWKSESQTALPETTSNIARGDYAGDGYGAEAEVGYKLTDHQTLTLNGKYYPNWYSESSKSAYTSSARRYTGTQATANGNLYGGFEATYDYNDDDKGHHFTLDATHTTWRSRSRNQTTQTYNLPTSGRAIYGYREKMTGPDTDIKADYERRYGSGNVLTAGAEWHINGMDDARQYNDSGTIAGPYANKSRYDFAGTQKLASLYFTYQRPLFAGWTMLPGLRLEQETIRIAGGGPQSLRAYPSLHLSYDLMKGKLKLSYSRRVNRPGLSQYDPRLIYQDAYNTYQGNPNLKPAETDSYEAGYDYTKDGVSYDATLYFRALENDLSSYTRYLGNGVYLSQDINAGHSRSGGAELTLKAPISKRWKYSANLNLYEKSVPLLTAAGQVSRGAFSYSGNASLEYDAPELGPRIGGDQVQLNLTVTGQQLQSQGYTKGRAGLDLTWRHNLNKDLSLIVVATDLFRGNRTTWVTDTPEIRSRSFSPANDRFLRISLTRKLGGPKAK